MKGLFLLFAVSSALFLEGEQQVVPPTGWRRLEDKASAEFPRRLSFAIPRENTEELEDLFWQVSDPKKAGYGQYLSIEEVGDRFPSDPTPVITWLASEGITWDATVNGDYVFAEMSTGTAARLFGCEFHVFQHSSGRRHVSSLGPYSVPDHLAGHVEFVSGLVGFPLTNDLHRPKHLSSSSTADIDPQVSQIHMSGPPSSLQRDGCWPGQLESTSCRRISGPILQATSQLTAARPTSSNSRQSSRSQFSL